MASEPSDDLDPVLLARYLSGEVSPEDRELVRRRIGEDLARRSQLGALGQAWERVGSATEAAAGVPASDAESVWQRLSARAHAASPALRATDRVSRFYVASRVAMMAVGLAVVLVIGRSYANHLRESATTYATGAGQRLHVRFADGSTVYLGPESELHVPAAYERGRHPIVLQGEGYFEVTHNALRPFAVRVRGTVVTDVGTRFSVRAYTEDRGIHVVVAQGEVMVNNTPIVAGDLAEIAGNDIAVTHGADVAAAMGWMQGRLVFNDTPLRDVVHELDRTFKMNVVLADSALAGELVTGNFGDQSVDRILDDITAVLGVRYERRGDQVMIRRGVANSMTPVNSGPRPILRTALVGNSHE